MKSNIKNVKLYYRQGENILNKGGVVVIGLECLIIISLLVVYMKSCVDTINRMLLFSNHLLLRLQHALLGGNRLHWSHCGLSLLLIHMWLQL